MRRERLHILEKEYKKLSKILNMKEMGRAIF